MHGRGSLAASQDRLGKVPSDPTTTPVTSRATANPHRLAVESLLKDALASLELGVCWLSAALAEHRPLTPPRCAQRLGSGSLQCLCAGQAVHGTAADRGGPHRTKTVLVRMAVNQTATAVHGHHRPRRPRHGTVLLGEDVEVQAVRGRVGCGSCGRAASAVASPPVSLSSGRSR